jgi:hypothetical protein
MKPFMARNPALTPSEGLDIPFSVERTTIAHRPILERVTVKHAG